MSTIAERLHERAEREMHETVDEPIADLLTDAAKRIEELETLSLSHFVNKTKVEREAALRDPAPNRVEITEETLRTAIDAYNATPATASSSEWPAKAMRAALEAALVPGRQEEPSLAQGELRACPFCSHSGSHHYVFSGGECIRCDSCGAEGPGASSEAEAIERWNERGRAQAGGEASISVKVREALEWYAAQVAGCRKLTDEGNKARAALDADGGKRAVAALSASLSPSKNQVTEDGARHYLETHGDAIRLALQHLHDTDPDEDDRAYYQHELRALDAASSDRRA